MAYGQTSAGKTHTLFGDLNSAREGIVPRFSRKLFEKFAEIEAAGTDQTRVTVSLFEIYKEKVFDLFADEPAPPLKVRDDPVRGLYFENLALLNFSDPTAFLDTLYKAFVRRRVSETLMNERSSRSHLVITFEVEINSRIDCAEAGADHKTVEITKKSKVIFIDLAGSERQGSNTAEVLSEGCAINRSLSVLQHVISSIAKRGSGDFAHFRDSKLTHFLKEIFRGNSHFAILGNVLAQPEYFRETVNTLNFVALAKRIVTNPQINFETKEGDPLLNRQFVELLSRKLTASLDAGPLNAQLEQLLTAVQTTNERVLGELERLHGFCNNHLEFRGYDDFKAAAEELDFEFMADLLRTYRELEAALSRFTNDKQAVDFEALKKSLQDLQAEVEAHFDARKDRVLQRIESLLAAVQLKLVGVNFERIANQSSSRKPVKRLKTVSCSRSFDFSERKVAELFPSSILRTLKHHSRILRQTDGGLASAPPDSPSPELPNSSAIRGSNLLDGTVGSFLGSFLPPFGGAASKGLPEELEKDIAQSITSYFQRERNWLESEKSKLEKEKGVFEEFRERELSAIKVDFRKSVAKNKEQFEVVEEGDGLAEPLCAPTPRTSHVATSVRSQLGPLDETPKKTTGWAPAIASPPKQASASEGELPRTEPEVNKRQMDALAKRITNLERQLRNRNKDYLFALKELEKVKVSLGRRDVPAEDPKPPLVPGSAA